MPVTVYTRAYCPFCVTALNLLRRKGVNVTEIDAGRDPSKRQEMLSRSGRFTFPQIFIGDTHVGGCDDLHRLERGGELDPLLRSV
ncbi:MAG TPA: glutaredoxin 3 [Caulobacterales bacterium]|nr:glutaredoxin 3 [Caulobacterales bacterium]